MREETVTIDKLAFGGSGVGRIGGKVCFVPYSAPGDILRVIITGEKKSYMIGSIKEIESPSKERVKPACPHFGVCGGCDWQHVSYQAQLNAKRDILFNSLSRIGVFPEEAIDETLPSPAEYNYRSRAQFKLHFRQGELKAGFFRTKTHLVEDIPDGCPVVAVPVNSALCSLRNVIQRFHDPAGFSQFDIYSADNGVAAVLHYDGKETEHAISWLREQQSGLYALNGLFLKNRVDVRARHLFGIDRFEYSMPASAVQSSVPLFYTPGGFSQVNMPQNRGIMELVRKFTLPDKKRKIIDLFCGNGNFSLPLAGEVASITGIEASSDSIQAAKENSRANGIGNAEFFCLDAAAGLRKLATGGAKFDTVILDPPRRGASDMIPAILNSGAETIVYISCDPMTLGRDCALLLSKGYRVKRSVPVDMFPQTYHTESVTLLERSRQKG